MVWALLPVAPRYCPGVPPYEIFMGSGPSDRWLEIEATEILVFAGEPRTSPSEYGATCPPPPGGLALLPATFEIL
jgi:hypothetical protein